MKIQLFPSLRGGATLAGATALAVMALVGPVFAGTNNNYDVDVLTSNVPGVAPVTDPNLINPWGMSYSPTGAFWISDNNSGLSTLYDGSGNIVPLVVTIPGVRPRAALRPARSSTARPIL